MGLVHALLAVLAVLIACACAQTNPSPSEAEIWATTVLSYGDQSTASSLDKDLTALVMTTPAAVPLFQFEYHVNSADTFLPTVAATTFSDTRAIALTHPGQFVGEGVTVAFWTSVLDWVTDGDLSAQIAVGFASHQTFLQGLGATNVVLVDFDESSVVLAPAGTDVLVLDYSEYDVWSDALMDRLYQTTDEFVSRTGLHGLIIGGESRYYKWTHYGSCSLFPANRVLADAGVLYLCDWWSNRGSDMLLPSTNYLKLHAYHSLAYIETITATRPLENADAAAIMSQDALSASLLGSLKGCFCGGDVNAPLPTASALHGSMLTIATSGNCESTIPIAPGAEAEKLCEELAYSAVSFADAVEIFAVSSSAAFPLLGETYGPSDLVTITADIDSDRCQDISTGIFVLPGQLVELTIPSSWVGHVSARVGQWRGDTHKFSTWHRNPNPLSSTMNLPTATTSLASGFGGHLYIHVPCDTFATEFSGHIVGQITATNVINAVYFHYGVTTEADWDSQLAPGSDRIAPWMELETDDLVYTIPKTTVDGLSFATMQEVSSYWSFITATYAAFRARQPDEFKERGVVDAAVAYGYMYASYPMVGPIGEAGNVVNLAQFYASGTWGWLHEAGHRFERGNSFGPFAGGMWNMFSGNVEVFTNVFTCQGIDNTVAENSRCSSSQEGIDDALSGETWSTMGPFEKLDFYIGVKLTYGWGVYTNTIARGDSYRFPESDAERKTRLFLLLSEEVGRNMRPMFDAWGIAVDDDLLYEQYFLVDHASIGIRFSDPLVDIGDGFATSFAHGAVLLGQAAPPRLFSSSQSAEFGGSNNGDISGPMPVNSGGEMSITFWLRLDDASLGASLVEALDGALASLWSLAVNGDGRLQYTWPTGSHSSAIILPQAQWMHVALVTDGASGVLYIDAEVDSEFPAGAFGVDPTPIMAINYGGLLVGALAELGYFESVLAPDRVLAQWMPSPYGFKPFLSEGFAPASLPSCPDHVIPQGIVACNTFDGVLGQPSSDCDACMAHVCDGAPAPGGGVDCSDVCPSGSIVHTSGRCDPCHETCFECAVAEDSNACLACDASTGYPHPEGSKCVASCSTDHVLVGNDCLPCHSTCATCDGTAPADCLSCDSGLLLEGSSCVVSCSPGGVEYDGSCLSECPEKFYDNEGVCASCDPRCLTCSGPDSTDCITCDQGGAFPLLHNAQCLSSCPASFFADSLFDCVPCAAECATCETTADTCTSCDEMGIEPWFFEFTCLADCPPYTTPDMDSGSCNGCDVLGEMPFLDGDDCVAVCPALHYQFQCVETCPAGHYADGTNHCKPCDAPCESCAESASTCISCDSLSAKPLLFDNDCVASCPAETFAQDGVCVDCHESCGSCNGSGETDCLTCPPATPQLHNGECLAECPEGHFSDSAQCVECDEQCDQCDGSGSNACTACGSGDVLHEGECLSSCPSTHFETTDGDIAVCDQCHSNCLTCSGTASTCTSCDPFGSSPVLEGSQCVGECNGVDLGGECVQSCPTGHFQNGAVCSACDAACHSCEDSASNCLACSPTGPAPLFDELTEECLASCGSVGRFALEGICVVECPFGMFAHEASSRCHECELPCAECDLTPTTCSSCDPLSGTPLLLDTDCFSKCPVGFYATTSHCTPCHDSCESCHSAGDTACTGCRSGFVLDSAGACVSEAANGCPALALQSVSAVASWPGEHSSSEQEVLCLPGTSTSDHCIPYGSRVLGVANLEVTVSAVLLCTVCDGDELISTHSKMVEQTVGVSIRTARSLHFLDALIDENIFQSTLTELFNVAAADSSLNAATLVAAESVFQDAIATSTLAELCQESSAVVQLAPAKVDSGETMELAAVGTLPASVCSFPSLVNWNDDGAYQPRCLCDESVASLGSPCAELHFAPFANNPAAICHPNVCNHPSTDAAQWVEVLIELDANFFAFDDAMTRRVLGEIAELLERNSGLTLDDLFLQRLDIGSVVMTLIIDSSASFDSDYVAAEGLVGDLNANAHSLSVPVSQARVVTAQAQSNAPQSSFRPIAPAQQSLTPPSRSGSRELSASSAIAVEASAFLVTLLCLFVIL